MRHLALLPTSITYGAIVSTITVATWVPTGDQVTRGLGDRVTKGLGEEVTSGLGEGVTRGLGEDFVAVL